MDEKLPLLTGLQAQVPLARFTAARLGGAADLLYIAKDPDYRDCRGLLQAAWAAGIPVTVLGGGANVLVADGGIRGLTIINRAARTDCQGQAERAVVRVSSGTNLIRLARYCQAAGLRGLEWAIAVPGTVGGAVVNNAGAHGGDMAQLLLRAELLEATGDGIVQRWLDCADMGYGYRTSLLKAGGRRRFFLCSAELALQRDDPARIRQRMQRYNAERRQRQPLGASLGSIFKNPPGDYAGRLIEAAGLKGEKIGAVQVSPLHANFFIAGGGAARAADYWRLIQLVQRRVHERFGIQLELEIQLFGAW